MMRRARISFIRSVVDGVRRFANDVSRHIAQVIRPVFIDHPSFGQLKGHNWYWVGKVDSAVMGDGATVVFCSPTNRIRSKEDAPTDAQYRILESYLEHEATLRAEIARAIFDEYNAIRQVNMPGSGRVNPFTGEDGIENMDEEYPPMSEADEVWDRIESSYIEVMTIPVPGYPELEISLHWEADWDGEHGLHVDLGQERVLQARME
jgi:hypothetical protein